MHNKITTKDNKEIRNFREQNWHYLSLFSRKQSFKQVTLLLQTKILSFLPDSSDSNFT